MKRALELSTGGFAITFAVWGMISALAPKFVDRLVVERRLLTAD